MSLANGPIEGARSTAPGADDADEHRGLRRLLLVMTSLVLVLGAVFGRHGLLEARQFRLERDRLQADIVRLEQENAAIEREVEALESDPSSVERIAREELGLVRPGEKLILLKPQHQEDPLVPSAPGLDAPGLPP